MMCPDAVPLMGQWTLPVPVCGLQGQDWALAWICIFGVVPSPTPILKNHIRVQHLTAQAGAPFPGGVFLTWAVTV